MLLGVISFCALLAFWLILSGHFTLFLVLAGVGSSAAVVWLAHRMEVVDREGVPAHFWRSVFSYWPWLGWEIAKAGWDVTKIILHPRLPVSPTLVRFAPTPRADARLRGFAAPAAPGGEGPRPRAAAHRRHDQRGARL